MARWLQTIQMEAVGIRVRNLRSTVLDVDFDIA